nr:MAG TPA: hypothetical protein [Caudoviricetes sp.]
MLLLILTDITNPLKTILSIIPQPTFKHKLFFFL